MIAGKTNDEIMLMKDWKRHLWYKTILLEEKERAMEIIEIARRSNLKAAWTPERRGKLSESNRGEDNPMKRPEVSVKFRGEDNPMRRPDVIAKHSGKNHHYFGKSPSEETRAKMSVAAIGRIQTKETKAKISKASAGKNNPMYGKTFIHTEEAKAKMSIAAIERWKDLEYRDGHTGENNPNWQNGVSFEPYGLEFNNELKEQIRKRDNYICQECDKIQEELDRKLDVHHIDYNKRNNKPENLISLCSSCHSKTNYNREDWIEYFKEKIKGVKNNG